MSTKTMTKSQIQEATKASEQMKKDYVCVQLLMDTGAQLKSTLMAFEGYMRTYHQDPAIRQLRDELNRLHKSVLNEQSKRTERMYKTHMATNHGQ